MCAIVGIAKHEEASNLAYLGLHALQHRGQEGAGIVTCEGGTAHAHRGEGLVGKIFDKDSLENLTGTAALGHTRYSTTGQSTASNVQPILMKSALGWIAVAHNGNLVNAASWVQKLEKEGAIFQTTTDTELFIHLIARSGETQLSKALVYALQRVEGAYSLLVMDKNTLIAVRDPHGFRPLVMGSLQGSTIFASETCAFDLVGAEYQRELKPGEMVITSLKDGKVYSSSFPLQEKPPRSCIFEHIYLARPDSELFGSNVHTFRKALGAQLALEHPTPEADVVIPVPDSGVPAAIGYAEASRLKFDMGIIRSHYVGRTFIEPKQSIRHFGVKLKLSPVKSALKDKKVVVVDDSLVRGTTSKKLIQQLRDAGAGEVHMRISSPPITHPCFYGIDTPTKEELIASNASVENIQRYIGANSLGYLSLEGLKQVGAKHSQTQFCDACFSGQYPTSL